MSWESGGPKKYRKGKKAPKALWTGQSQWWVDGVLWSKSEIITSMRVERASRRSLDKKPSQVITRWLKKFGVGRY